jgi:small subunit ribosomal protein S35
MTFGRSKNVPVARKATIVVPVSLLPLSSHPGALHKFKLLAGVRWSPEPPKDSGLGKEEVETLGNEGRGEGYFKISHEAFPELAMNLKWCSDTLDALVQEANVSDIYREVLSNFPTYILSHRMHPIHSPTSPLIPAISLPELLNRVYPPLPRELGL